jgi:hypothetical protein
LFGHPSPEQFEKLISLVDCPYLTPGDSRYVRGCDICTQIKMVDFTRRPRPITKSFMLKHRLGKVLNFDGQTFGIRSCYGNYIAVVNFVRAVRFKRFPFYVRSYDAPELRNALEYARRMVRLLFGVELRALHSDVFGRVIELLRLPGGCPVASAPQHHARHAATRDDSLHVGSSSRATSTSCSSYETCWRT